MKKLSLFVLIVLVFSFVSANSMISAPFDVLSMQNTTIVMQQIVRSPHAQLQISTNSQTNCKYSQYSFIPYDFMEGNFDYKFGILFKEIFSDLKEGTYTYYIKCKDDYGNQSGQLSLTFNVNLPISAKISIDKGNIISNGNFLINVITSKIVYQTPSLTYSVDGINYNPIPLFGSGDKWQGYLNIPATLGNKIGSFKFDAKDLEGQNGNLISEGGSFLIDTQKPDSVGELKSYSDESKIELDWYYSGDDYSLFKVYRSEEAGVLKSDFYKSVTETKILDNSVEKGKIYYYRVSVVDKADNEGELSSEISVNVLSKNSSGVKSNLDIKSLAAIESLSLDVDFVYSQTNDILNKYNSNSGKEKDIFYSLKLDKVIDSIQVEIRTIKKEIDNLKAQSISREELDKKINSIRVKLNALKTRVPESLIIVSDKSFEKKINEEDLRKLVLEINPSVDDKILNLVVSDSIKESNDNKLEIKSSYYGLNIIYLDGNKKEITFVKEKLMGNFDSNGNFSFYESIPKEFSESASNLNLINTDYQVAKEDLILSFPSSTNEIAYYINGNKNEELANRIKTIFLNDLEDYALKNTNHITGYISLVEFNNTSYGVLIGVLAVIFLAFYLFYIRKETDSNIKLLTIRRKLDTLATIDDLEVIDKKYSEIKEDYNKLSNKEKKIVYPEINKLSEFMKSTVLK